MIQQGAEPDLLFYSSVSLDVNFCLMFCDSPGVDPLFILVVIL